MLSPVEAESWSENAPAASVVVTPSSSGVPSVAAYRATRAPAIGRTPSAKPDWTVPERIMLVMSRRDSGGWGCRASSVAPGRRAGEERDPVVGRTGDGGGHRRMGRLQG